MTFRAYDILANLLPGVLSVFVLREVSGYQYDKDLIVAYTVVAFLAGYFINAIGSWLEEFYFLTWGGKPSRQLLEGKDIWKVRFYEATEAKRLLKEEWGNKPSTNDQLFAVAMRSVNSMKDTRISDFAGMYAFSRALLTAVVVCALALCIQNRFAWTYCAGSAILIFVFWLRCKQQAYFYAREVLNEFIRLRSHKADS